MKLKVFACAFLLLGAIVSVSAQKEIQTSGGWSVKCVDRMEGREEIPCEKFSFENGRNRLVRDLGADNDYGKTRATIIFRLLKRDDTRFLKITSVTPALDENDETQEYWFQGQVQGYGGSGQDLIFVTLSMKHKPHQNMENQEIEEIPQGTYTGIMDFEDDQTGEKFTFELMINVLTRD